MIAEVMTTVARRIRAPLTAPSDARASDARANVVVERRCLTRFPEVDHYADAVFSEPGR